MCMCTCVLRAISLVRARENPIRTETREVEGQGVKLLTLCLRACKCGPRAPPRALHNYTVSLLRDLHPAAGVN